MHYLRKKISDLEWEIALENFSEYSNKTWLANAESRLKEMKQREFDTLKYGVAVRIDNQYFLSALRTLPYSDEPTWFDNKEEAQEFIDKADLNADVKLDCRFVEWEEYHK